VVEYSDDTPHIFLDSSLNFFDHATLSAVLKRGIVDEQFLPKFLYRVVIGTLKQLCSDFQLVVEDQGRKSLQNDVNIRLILRKESEGLLNFV